MSLDGKKILVKPHDERDFPRRKRTSFPLHISFSDSLASTQFLTNSDKISSTKHLNVNGDLIKSSSSGLNYILHRQPFDW